MTIHTSRPALGRAIAVFVGLFSALLAGCSLGNSASVIQRDPNQVFVYPNTVFDRVFPASKTELGLSLDPAFAGEIYSQTVIEMTQVQLVTFDQNLNIVPDAASSWEVSPDGLTWTFHLRPNLLWADGQQMTSADFKLAMDHDLDPNLCKTPGPLLVSCQGQIQSGYLSYIQGANEYLNQIPDKTTGKPPTSISGIDASDPQKLIFHLTQPISFFLGQLATIASVPIESKWFIGQKYGYNYILHFADPNNPVSQSGPFIIQKWFNRDNPSDTKPQDFNEIDFAPNPHWWGKPVNLKEVKMPLVADPHEVYVDYQTDTPGMHVDYTKVIPADYTFAANLPDFHATPWLAIDFFGMNYVDPPFDNVQVRRAFALALNKQSLVDSIFQGAISPTNHIIPYGIPGYNPNLVMPDNSITLTGDPQKAQTLIAGVANQCLQDYHDWCPYIIGDQSGTLESITAASNGGANCPNYKVYVSSSGKTTQRPIIVYGASDQDARKKMARGAAQEWASVLCLNVSDSNASPSTQETGSQILNDVYTYAGQGKATKEPVWTVGYAADYIDPQDYTTNQFGPTTLNNATNFGVANTADGDLSNQKAIQSLMAKADVMPYTTPQQKQLRIQAYQNIEQQLVNDVAWIPYDQQQSLYRLRPYVMNFTMPPSGVLSDVDWPDVYIAAHG